MLRGLEFPINRGRALSTTLPPSLTHINVSNPEPWLGELSVGSRYIMPPLSPLVRWFASLGIADVSEVGGKNASLGELYSRLGAAGVRVPNGFALTAGAYRQALT